MNFYKHHLGDYDGATMHLSWDEDQAYTRLLRVYYRLEKQIPLEPGATFRLVRAITKGQKEAVTRVLHEFFKEEADGWHNIRADEEIVAYQAQAATNKRIARQRTDRRTADEPFNESLPDRSPNHKPRTKKKQKDTGAFAPPDWVPIEAWTAWLEVRKKKRSPNTDEALRLSVLDLEGFRDAGQDPRAVLEQSVKRGWQGLFEVKSQGQVQPDSEARVMKLGNCQCGAQATMKVGGKPRCSAHARGLQVAA